MKSSEGSMVSSARQWSVWRHYPIAVQEQIGSDEL